jgi:hypothetical protein
LGWSSKFSAADVAVGVAAALAVALPGVAELQCEAVALLCEEVGRPFVEAVP